MYMTVQSVPVCDTTPQYFEFILLPIWFTYNVTHLVQIPLYKCGKHWYADMSPLHKNSSSVSIGSSLLILHFISRKVRDIYITRIVPNTNLLRYLIPPNPACSNMFVEHNLNHVSLKFTHPFKETYGSRIIFVKDGGFHMMGAPLKFQQCMPILFHIIQ